MKKTSDKITIIAELHPQHGGDINELKRMILQCAVGGADGAKVQLYSSQLLFGDDRRKDYEISFEELEIIKVYADNIGIDLLASVFDVSRIDWCEKLGFKYYKIASRSSEDRYLCETIIQTGKPIFISVNLREGQGFPYPSNNVNYFYCVSSYPALLEQISIPKFERGGYIGFSDHTIGLTASKTAIVNGAKYIEKHMTLSKAFQSSLNKGHLGAMDMDDLSDLRRFSEEFVRIGKDAK